MFAEHRLNLLLRYGKILRFVLRKKREGTFKSLAFLAFFQKLFTKPKIYGK